MGLTRKRNEDRYIIKESKGLFAVCDGMGGHKAGDVASHIAIQILEKTIDSNDSNNPIEVLNLAIGLANREIREKGEKNSDWYQMGTTITAAILMNNELSIANVGDSSIYLIRDMSIKKLTTDHTLAEQLVMDGIMSPVEMRDSSYNHILTRALGVEEEVIIDNFKEQVFPGDFILICSDGLTDMLEAEEILSIIAGSEIMDVDLLAQTLMNRALDKGGYDNITLILLHI